MSRRFQIAVLPGDGIGVDVTRETVRVLEAVAARGVGLAFDFQEHSVGAEEFLRSGDPLPPAAFEACRAADARPAGGDGAAGRPLAGRAGADAADRPPGAARPVLRPAAGEAVSGRAFPAERHQPGEIDF